MFTQYAEYNVHVYACVSVNNVDVCMCLHTKNVQRLDSYIYLNDSKCSFTRDLQSQLIIQHHPMLFAVASIMMPEKQQTCSTLSDPKDANVDD